MPNARCATSPTLRPIRPKPMIPSVLPVSSRPVSEVRSRYLPAARADIIRGKCLDSPIMNAKACWLTLSVFAPGVESTWTPSSVAASTSISSKPTPWRPTTLRPIRALEHRAIDDPAGPDHQGVGPDDLALKGRRIERGGHPDLARVAEQVHPRLVHRGQEEQDRSVRHDRGRFRVLGGGWRGDTGLDPITVRGRVPGASAPSSRGVGPCAPPSRAGEGAAGRWGRGVGPSAGRAPRRLGRRCGPGASCPGP